MYDKHLDLDVAFPQKNVQYNLGQILSEHGLKQLRISETEKYAHVTYFFNSQVEKPYLGENRIMVPSLKVPNYEEKPEMSAREINKKLIPEINNRKHHFILVNYANGDLVGHSANLYAGIKACETVDQCVGEVVETGLKNGYVILVTGDHGNIETRAREKAAVLIDMNSKGFKEAVSKEAQTKYKSRFMKEMNNARTTIKRKANRDISNQYQEAYDAGYLQGKEDNAIYYYCNVCGKMIYVTPGDAQHQAIVDCMHEKGWGHGDCHMKNK